MRNIVTPCGEGRVTMRSCEDLVQAGSMFPGRKRIVKSNTESNRVESEGPESAVLHIMAHGRAVRKWRAWQRENAGCWPLHLAYMYVLCQRAFCIRAVATSSSSFSLVASFPVNFSFRPPFLHDVHTASFLLIKSRLPPFVFSIFSSVSPALRKSQDSDSVNELGKANARTEKGESALQYSVGMLNRSLVQINNPLESC